MKTHIADKKLVMIFEGLPVHYANRLIDYCRTSGIAIARLKLAISVGMIDIRRIRGVGKKGEHLINVWARTDQLCPLCRRLF